jgi:mRNA interferase RelE/StbE
LAWTVEVSRSVEKELRQIGPEAARRVLRFLRERVAVLDDPRSIGGPLHGPELGRYWKYRVGQFRVIASIQDEVLVILIVRVRHRKDVYD